LAFNLPDSGFKGVADSRPSTTAISTPQAKAVDLHREGKGAMRAFILGLAERNRKTLRMGHIDLG
jgi:hypothetical protein